MWQTGLAHAVKWVYYIKDIPQSLLGRGEWFYSILRGVSDWTQRGPRDAVNARGGAETAMG